MLPPTAAPCRAMLCWAGPHTTARLLQEPQERATHPWGERMQHTGSGGTPWGGGACTCITPPLGRRHHRLAAAAAPRHVPACWSRASFGLSTLWVEGGTTHTQPSSSTTWRPPSGLACLLPQTLNPVQSCRRLRRARLHTHHAPFTSPHTRLHPVPNTPGNALHALGRFSRQPSATGAPLQARAVRAPAHRRPTATAQGARRRPPPLTPHSLTPLLTPPMPASRMHGHRLV